MKNIIIIPVLMMVLLSSCKTKHLVSKEKLAPAGYVQWVENEENGLKMKQQDAPYSYELQYQPVEYLAVRRTKSLQISSSAVEEEKQKRGDLLYFTFKLWNEKGRGVLSDKDVQIENKSSYLLSGLQNDMMLLAGADTLQCVMLHFESANSLIPYDQCVLAFESPINDKEDIVFLYCTDKYRKGWVRMPMKRENMKRMPRLKTI